MKELCLILWMLFSLILVFSLVGLLLFVPNDFNNQPSTWCLMGRKLLDAVIKD